MKKIVLTIVTLLAFYTGFAQDKKVQIGLRLAPNISFTSLTDGSAWKDSQKGSSGLRLMFGPTFDIFFGENYAFATGLWYNVKAMNLDTKFAYASGAPASSNVKYNLQYLTIPATIKLYTNEVMDDVRVYFQVGGTLDFKLAEKLKGGTWPPNSANTDEKYVKPLNVGPYLGVGGELVLSSSNTVFAGLNYSRGVLPLLDNSVQFNDGLKTQTGQFALEVGLKF
jgi:hypothetical protein